MQLREYQVDAIQAIRGEYKKGHSKPILCLPTGAGKTVIAAEIINRALERGAHRVVFMIDSLTLVEQTIKSFAAYGIKVGVIQGLHDLTDISKQVQIATPQTIKRRLAGRNAVKFGKLYRVDLLIVDECHVQHTGIKDAAEHWGCPVLGLTATPYSKGLGLFYDSVIQPIKLDALTEQGYLAPYRVFSHDAPDMSKVKVQAGDYVAKQAAEQYDTRLIGSVLSTWLKYGESRQTLGFASTVASAQAFSEMFSGAGIKSDFTSGYLDSEDAIERLAKFQSGETTVLWNVQKLTKGFDMPSVSCMIDCAPTKSLSLHIQKGGRVLRTHADKEYALVLDHSGNYIRNGFLEEAEIDYLCQGEGSKDKASTEKLPKPCPKCGMIKKTQVCPSCGFKANPRADIETEAGELVELKSAMAKRNRDDDWGKKVAFMAELNAHAENKKYKRGWVVNQYKARYSVLPWDSRLKNVPPAEVISVETQKWIISKQIAYAKRRAS